MLKIEDLISESKEKKDINTEFVETFNNFYYNENDKLLYFEAESLDSLLLDIKREKRPLYRSDIYYYRNYLKLDYCFANLKHNLFDTCQRHNYKIFSSIDFFITNDLIKKAYDNFEIIISHFTVQEQEALRQYKGTERMFSTKQLDNVTKNNLVGEFWEKFFLTIVDSHEMLQLFQYNKNKFLQLLKEETLLQADSVDWVISWEDKKFHFPIVDNFAKIFKLSPSQINTFYALFADNTLNCLPAIIKAQIDDFVSLRYSACTYLPYLYSITEEDLEDLIDKDNLIKAQVFKENAKESPLDKYLGRVDLLESQKGILQLPHNTSEQVLIKRFLPFVQNNSTLTPEDFSYLKDSVDYLQKVLVQDTPKDILLWGPPGFGKTQLVRTIAKHLNIEIIETVEKHVTNNVRFNLISTAKNIKDFSENFCILIDEAEDILKDKEHKSVLIQELENKKVHTFWIVNDIENIAEAFLRRFDYILQINEMPLDVRVSLAKKYLSDKADDSLAYKIAQSIHTPAEIKSAIDWCHTTDNYSWANISNKIMNYQRALSKSLKSELGDFTIDVISPDGAFSLNDFAGYHYVKNEARDILDVFTHPEKYNSIGAKIPKGIILAGSPGVGKTMFTRCLSNHLSTTLIKADSSALAKNPDRIKILFEKAKSHAPCILFLDEIDVLGSSVIDPMGKIDTEKQKILNQLLTEIDGFECFSGVMVIGATHRANILDEALTRSGRLGKTIYFREPSFEDRKEIIEYYCAKIKKEDNINYHQLAKLSASFTSADISVAINEAALTAARENKTIVTNQHLVDSVNQVFFGTTLNGMPVKNSEKWKTAIHEAGHALVAIKNGRTPQRATIKPHMNFMGMVEIEEQEGVYSTSLKMLKSKIEIFIAGLVAEELIFSEHSNGVSGDLDVINRFITRSMEKNGMSETLKQMTILPGQAVSDSLLEKMEQEKIRIIEEAKELTKNWLLEHKKELIDFAKLLYEHRSLDIDTMNKWFNENVLKKDSVVDNEDIEFMIQAAYQSIESQK